MAYPVPQRKITGIRQMVKATPIANVRTGRLYALSWLGSYGLAILGEGFRPESEFTIYKVTSSNVTELGTVKPSDAGCNILFPTPGYHNILYCASVNGNSVTVKALNRDLQWVDVFTISLPTEYTDPSTGSTYTFSMIDNVVPFEDRSGAAYALIIATYYDEYFEETQFGVVCKYDGSCGSFSTYATRYNRYAVFGWRSDWRYVYVITDNVVRRVDTSSLSFDIIRGTDVLTYSCRSTVSPYGKVLEICIYEDRGPVLRVFDYDESAGGTDMNKIEEVTITKLWTRDGLVDVDTNSWLTALAVHVYGATYAYMVLARTSDGFGRANVLYKTNKLVDAFIEVDGSDRLDPSVFDRYQELLSIHVCFSDEGVSPCKFIPLPQKMSEYYII